MILDFHRRAVVQTLKSYRRVKLSFLADRLRVPPSRVEPIVVQLILDGDIAARIDAVNGVIDLTQRAGGAAKKYAALQAWNQAIRHITSANSTAQA